jgi:hypothetical protein
LLGAVFSVVIVLVVPEGSDFISPFMSAVAGAVAPAGGVVAGVASGVAVAGAAVVVVVSVVVVAAGFLQPATLSALTAMPIIRAVFQSSFIGVVSSGFSDCVATRLHRTHSDVILLQRS